MTRRNEIYYPQEGCSMKEERAIPEGYMTVGQLAEKMGTTVRALQYYHTKGLLLPSAESSGGRRLYTHRDICLLYTSRCV